MKKILMIGAGFLQSFVIKRAKELGYYTYALDGNPKAEGFALADEFCTINIVDEDACLAYACEHAVDGVLTAATDYGVLTASRIAERLKLPGIRYASAKRIKNKYAIRKRLFETRADDTALSYEIGDEETIQSAAENVTFPVMVKPCDGSGSRGAARVDNKEDFACACREAMAQSLTHCAIAEQFITGEEYGVESFVHNGVIRVLAIMKKWMTNPPYYAELGHAIPSGLPLEVEERIKSCVTKAIRALEINFGSVNMDLLLTPAGKVHIVDIGARMGGNLIGSHIVPTGTGIAYVDNMIKAAVGDEPCWEQVNRPRPVATRLLALSPGVVKRLPDINEIGERYGATIEHHLRVGDAIHEYHTNLDGCGYVVCSADTALEAAQNAEAVKRFIDSGIVREG